MHVLQSSLAELHLETEYISDLLKSTTGISFAYRTTTRKHSAINEMNNTQNPYFFFMYSSSSRVQLKPMRKTAVVNVFAGDAIKAEYFAIYSYI
jgi:hypothetical protein